MKYALNYLSKQCQFLRSICKNITANIVIGWHIFIHKTHKKSVRHSLVWFLVCFYWSEHKLEQESVSRPSSSACTYIYFCSVKQLNIFLQISEELNVVWQHDISVQRYTRHTYLRTLIGATVFSAGTNLSRRLSPCLVMWLTAVLGEGYKGR